MPFLSQCVDFAKKAALPQLGAVDKLIPSIRTRWHSLKADSPQDLCARGHSAKLMAARQGVDSDECRILAFALMAEALRRSRGIELYDVQIRASLALAGGNIAEMQTGEGKTFSCAPAAYLHSLAGRGVHIATPNDYLASRDFDLVLPAFRLLGGRAGLLSTDSDASRKQEAYQCDVTYGPGHEFGFDYLRDQLSLRAESQRQLGEHLISGTSPSDHRASLLQRGLYYAIIDEIDNVLLDDAASPLVLSQASGSPAADADVCRAARKVALRLDPETHFRASAALSGVRLTSEGEQLIHDCDSTYDVELLQRTWTEYIEQALRAETLQRDVHYTVDSEG
ncbi:MAG: hypothetical protein MPJ50_06370, partial [Pirellulales bacterium]|nr:hypothetical protein [Pirellulales bacterium]